MFLVPNNPGGGTFSWFGDRVMKFVGDRVERNMHAMGAAIVQRARAYAPARTGRLRESIYYAVERTGEARSVLHVGVGVPYGIYQEFGTRNIPPHPFIRPAMNEVGRAWTFNLSMDFAGTPGFAGLLGSTGQGRSPGFAASASPKFRRLTPKQAHHVETVLRPSIRQHHRGNVKRAGFRVRHD